MPTAFTRATDFGRLLECGDSVRRPADQKLCVRIKQLKADAERELCRVAPGKCGVSRLDGAAPRGVSTSP